jgi:ribose transport system substrate-binding protein
MKHLPAFVLVLLLSAASFFSCSKKNPTQSSKVIGVSLLTRNHLFYRDLEQGLQEEAAKHNYKLIITSAEFDLGKQLAQIDDFVARKADAIIVCPVDSKGVGEGIKKANAANIPVFTADIAAEEGNVICHVASDNVAGGKLAGDYLAKLLNGRGKVAIIDQPAITSVLDRVRGFRESIAKFPGITIVADVDGQGVRDKALEAASDVLQAHPDLNGIFGINDDSALGAMDAALQFGRTSLAIIGYDATPPAVDAILKNSPLKADVIQYPEKIGMTTIQKIADYFSGVAVPKTVPVEVGIADKVTLAASHAQ